MNGRRLKIGLLLSLGLNLFLIGLMVGGAFMSARSDAERRSRPRPAHYWAAAEKFDPADREAFREMMRREARENAPRLQALRQARRDARAAVTNEPYDPVAAGAALARAHREELALRAEVDAAVLEFARRLDTQERAALAEAMRRRKGRGGGEGRR